ncbi:MAG: sugar kinase [Actinomycetota bacterium]|nr:sugar kinase [Actinomycetota bacterium]
MASEPRFDVATIGELLGVLTPMTVGPIENVTHFEKSVGGAEVNVAIGLARLGCSVAWAGHVGADPLGREGLRTLRRHGVDTSGAKIDDDAPTGLYIKELSDSEDATAFYYRGGSAASRMTYADLDVDLLLSCRILHLTGITAMISPACEDLVNRLAAHAVAHGVPISFDANIRPGLLGDRSPGAVLGPLIDAAHLIFTSKAEACALFGTADPPELARRLPPRRTATVIVHESSTAAVVRPDGVVVQQAAHRRLVIDPVGAGDAFVSAYLFSWLRHLPHERALDLAHECAAEVIGVRGDHLGTEATHG